MTCKGICGRYKAARPSRYGGRYAAGQKWCHDCDTYMNWDNTTCPCCGVMLRLRPRNRLYRVEAVRY